MRVVRDRPRRPDPGFADLYATLPDAADLEPWLEWCRQAAPPVLYLGIGAGRLAVPFAREGISLVGLDAHPGMLRRLRSRLPGQPLVRALAEEPPFDGAFDLVIGPSGILCTPARLRAAAGVIRPSGRVALELMNPHWLLGMKRPDVRVGPVRRGRAAIEVDYAGGFTQVANAVLVWPERVEELLGRAGLKLESLRGAGSLRESPTYYALASKRLRSAQMPST